MSPRSGITWESLTSCSCSTRLAAWRAGRSRAWAGFDATCACLNLLPLTDVPSGPDADVDAKFCGTEKVDRKAMAMAEEGGGGGGGREQDLNKSGPAPITRHTRARLFCFPSSRDARFPRPPQTFAILSIVAVMSDVAGPSTPSRKRSRWDTDEDNTPQVDNPVPKRRAKSKATAPNETPTPERVATPPLQSQSFIGRPRPPHSRYVPPRTDHPPFTPSRSVYCYERLNSIEEGSYGVVFRARDKETGDIVALKKLKLEEEKHGFPITALREINSLMVCKHENVVGIREVVVGDTLTQYVVWSTFQTSI